MTATGHSQARIAYAEKGAAVSEEFIDPLLPPSGPGCVQCEATQGWWFELRRCARCGHIGCCDTSLSQHATAHARPTGHAVITRYEPVESWFYDYRDESVGEGPRLAPPKHHPTGQPSPGRPGACHRTGANSCTGP